MRERVLDQKGIAVRRTARQAIFVKERARRSKVWSDFLDAVKAMKDES